MIYSSQYWRWHEKSREKIPDSVISYPVEYFSVIENFRTGFFWEECRDDYEFKYGYCYFSIIPRIPMVLSINEEVIDLSTSINKEVIFEHNNLFELKVGERYGFYNQSCFENNYKVCSLYW